MLKIYNTLSRKKDTFIPRIKGKVGLYVCGMTVYDYCHIGHARVMVVFDTVARYLRYAGYDLTYVRNITDIDDKIIKCAHKKDEPFLKLTQRFIDVMHEDERALAVLPPDIEPKATQSIDAIIAMITTLINKGLAYVGSNGDVFYAVSKFKDYGKLSGKNIQDLRIGERVAMDPAKQNAIDFVLWKMAKPNEPSWDSPWGKGRPGWHIECSAMSTYCLGEHFDIHGGGADLQFPHHENEIAQSEGASGKPFVNIWMHNGFVRINQEKMSKSLDNFFTVREVSKKYHPETIRFFILTSHYRSPLNYANEQLNEAASALTRLYTAVRNIEIKDITIDSSYENNFKQAMDDDFNTPLALSVLFDCVREINKLTDNEQAQRLTLAATLKSLAGLLGILQRDPEQALQTGFRYYKDTIIQVKTPAPITITTGKVEVIYITNEQIEKHIQRRLVAKKNKNWHLADEIRDTLKKQGVILEDVAGDTSWRRK